MQNGDLIVILDDIHIGNEQVCIAESKRTEHALVIQYDPEHTYYIHATPNSEHDYTINSSSIHKLKADYNGTNMQPARRVSVF